MRGVEAGVPTVERVIGERAEPAVQGRVMVTYSTTSMANQVWLSASTLSEAPADCQTESLKTSPGLTAKAALVRFWPARRAAPWRAMGCPWKAAPFFVTSAWRSPVALLWQWRLPGG